MLAVRLVLLSLPLLALLAGLPVRSATSTVLSLEIDTVIHPLTVDYMQQGLDAAKARGAEAVIVRLSTPGGLDTAMREVIEKILQSPVPVIAWVGPSGSRAASAGFLILLSADVAAMAPGTNTGAAHPVLLTGKMDDVMKQKVEQDAAAYIRSITGKRGRNVEMAEKGVIESKSFTENEALQNKLIDLVAESPRDLLAKVSGRAIQRFDGRQITLNLANAEIVEYQPGARYKLLKRVIDPNIAFILLALGALGLYIEFTHPGAIAPGVAGAILLLLGMFALSLLPINWLGVLLIVLAFVFFLLEAMVMSHGVLAIGGIASLILGAIMLVDTAVPEMRVSIVTALSVAIPLGLITVFLVRLAVKAWKSKVVTGEAGLLDEIGTAHTDLAPDGKIFIHGELWNAVASTPVSRGKRVRVRAVDGLTLEVEPADGSVVPVEQTRPTI